MCVGAPGVMLDASEDKAGLAETWLSQFTFDDEKHLTVNAIDPLVFFPTNKQYWHYTSKNGIESPTRKMKATIEVARQ
jgi:carbonic anhydrase